MAISTPILKTGYISTNTPLIPSYAPSATEPKKAAIVKTMRFINTGTDTAKLRAWFQKGGGKFRSEVMSNPARRILEYDQPLASGFSLVEDRELTLDSGDGIYFQTSVGAVEFVLYGIEQDVS